MHKTESALASIGKFFIGGFRTRRLDTWRKVFKKHRLTGKEYATHDRLQYPHSSTRQRARYARQIAADQLRVDMVTTPAVVVEPVKAKKPRTRKTVGSVVE